MLGTVLHLHRGTPYVYQGEELGMTNVAVRRASSDFRDIESLNHYAEAVARRRPTRATCSRRCGAMSRDNARTPMQWDASAHAGFTTGTPWIAVNPNHVDDQRARRGRRPRLRLPPLPAADRAAAREPVVAHGDFTMLLPDHEQVYAFTRSYAGTELLVLGNFSGDAVDVDVPGWEGAELVLGNVADPVPAGWRRGRRGSTAASGAALAPDLEHLAHARRAVGDARVERAHDQLEAAGLELLELGHQRVEPAALLVDEHDVARADALRRLPRRDVEQLAPAPSSPER